MEKDRSHAGFLFHGVVALAWLGFLAVANTRAPQPVTSIFPYLAPVVFFAWVHSAKWGFLFAGLATVAAIPGDFPGSHSTEELLYAGFSTYAQLSGAVIGCALAKTLSNGSGHF